MLRQIKYFQAVVRCGSFTQAAEECYISQSAISQQIQALEQELDIKLLVRGNRKFSVTPAGKYFYEKSLAFVADFEKLCRETVRIAHEDDPQLCIGYLKCYSGKEFQQAVEDFTRKYPDVVIHIISGNHEELYDELRLGRVDLILSDQRRAFSDEYVNSILTTSECYIEVAGRSPIAVAESIDIQELKDIPCILVASKAQRKNEQSYYHDIVGISSEFLFAENLEEARSDVLCDRFLKGAADPQHLAMDGTIAGFRGFLRCLPGAQEKDILYGTGTWNLNDVYRHPAYENAYEMGKLCR